MAKRNSSRTNAGPSREFWYIDVVALRTPINTSKHKFGNLQSDCIAKTGKCLTLAKRLNTSDFESLHKLKDG